MRKVIYLFGLCLLAAGNVQAESIVVIDGEGRVVRQMFTVPSTFDTPAPTAVKTTSTTTTTTAPTTVVVPPMTVVRESPVIQNSYYYDRDVTNAALAAGVTTAVVGGLIYGGYHHHHHRRGWRPHRWGRPWHHRW